MRRTRTRRGTSQAQIAIATWQPGDTTPGSIATVATSAHVGDAWFGSAVSPDHRTVLLADTPRDGQGTLVNLRDGTQLTLKGEHSAPILGGAFSPDGSLVATSGADGATRLWNATSGSLVETLVGHDGQVWAPTISDTGGGLTLHTASLDGKMMTWDLSGSRRLGEPFQAGAGTDVLPVPIWDGPHVAVSPDGRLLAVNDIDGTSILDATTHAVVRTLKATQPDGSFDATWSPDGRRLAVTGTGTAIAELYDTATWQRVAPDGGPLAGPRADRPALANEIRQDDAGETGRRLNGARAVAFSPDSTELVAGTDDGAVWTWNARPAPRWGSRCGSRGPFSTWRSTRCRRTSPSATRTGALGALRCLPRVRRHRDSQ